jgi:putative Mg2+ transporter-C (MgtC) family protein
MFTMYATYATGPGDAARLAAGIVTAIGFLGAGVILRERGQIVGLTTAATVWVAAAIGMGIGFGAYTLVAVGLVAILVVLWLLPFIEVADRASDTFLYEVTAPSDEALYAAFKERIAASGLKVHRHFLSRRGAEMIATWQVSGPAESQHLLMHAFTDDADVRDFRVTPGQRIR